jgi:hypothetical protein
MSAHSSKAMKCSCGGYFIFSEYHWPHCRTNPERTTTTGRKASLFEQRTPASMPRK